jgi:ribosomal protein S7
LLKARKTFQDREKRCIPKISTGRIRDLSFLRVLFQSLIFFGRKKFSFKVFIKLLDLLKFKYKGKFIYNYLYSVEQLRPLIDYRLMHIGGKRYKIPILMPIAKGYVLGIRWLINDLVPGADITLTLFNNLINLSKKEGALIKYRKEHHSLAFENKTYIRFLRHFKSGF